MQAVLILAVTAFLMATSSGAIYDYEPMEMGDSEYYPSERIIHEAPTKRASCVARGGSCDHKSSDCCSNTVCRCNLWGANCRCKRKSFFTSD